MSFCLVILNVFFLVFAACGYRQETLMVSHDDDKLQPERVEWLRRTCMEV